MRKQIRLSIDLPEHVSAAAMGAIRDSLAAHAHDLAPSAALSVEAEILPAIDTAATPCDRCGESLQADDIAHYERQEAGFNGGGGPYYCEACRIAQTPYICPCGHTGPMYALAPTCGSCGGGTARPTAPDATGDRQATIARLMRLTAADRDACACGAIETGAAAAWDDGSHRCYASAPPTIPPTPAKGGAL